MVQWKRTARTAGASLSAVALGLVLSDGTAGAQGFDPHSLKGEVTSVGVNSFTITAANGSTRTIDTTSSTTYDETGTPVAPTGLQNGELVRVDLESAAATPTASRVTVVLNRVSGKVTALSGSTVTLAGRPGTSRQFIVSPDTKYYEGSTSASGVTVGERVSAFGAPDATTSSELDAIYVDLAPSTPPIPAKVPPRRLGGPGPVAPAPGSNPTPTTAVTSSSTSAAPVAPARSSSRFGSDAPRGGPAPGNGVGHGGGFTRGSRGGGNR
jgi:hypothetical protein